ncbi:MAG: glucose/galactose MFS transporter [Mariniphaga sp.]
MSQAQKTFKSGGNYFIPLAILGILFFVIGFGVGISGILIPFLKKAFTITTSQSYLVTAAIFSAFVIFGAPSGMLIKKFGYKTTMLIAFFVMAFGMVLFVPSAHYQSFPFFLLALFIGGIGNTILQAAVNPYVTIIGPKESAAMRMCLMGIMNKAAWWLGPLFLGIFLDINNAKLEDVTFPFYLVAGILAGLGIFMYFAPLPEVKAEGEDETDQGTSSSITGNKTSIMQFPHLLLGVATLFIYVGVETLPMASMLDFAKSVFPDADLTGYSKYVPIGLMIGYIFGVFMIPKIISQTTALKIVTILGIGASLALIFLPGNIGIYCLAAIGFANSLMWPAIWPLAIADLGKFTKTGASLLVMGIVGGAVIPLIFGVLVDTFKGANALVTTANFQSAYWIFIPGYLFILYFAIWGHKIRK